MRHDLEYSRGRNNILSLQTMQNTGNSADNTFVQLVQIINLVEISLVDLNRTRLLQTVHAVSQIPNEVGGNGHRDVTEQ